MIGRADVDVVMLAGRWTLTERSGEPLLEAAAERGVGILAAAPYNSGLLAHNWPADDATFNYLPAAPDVLARARAYATVARASGVTLPDLALQFPLRHPAVTSVVVGLRTPGEARQTRDRVDAAVDRSLWLRLDDA
jgi:D-threo-aldose 1-dehydrogenase